MTLKDYLLRRAERFTDILGGKKNNDVYLSGMDFIVSDYGLGHDVLDRLEKAGFYIFEIRTDYDMDYHTTKIIFHDKKLDELDLTENEK